jgi:transcriptional regulator with XRE-family HTH domain
MSARRPASQAERARAFGDHVRRLRKARRLSQRQVAETIPMSPGNLSRIEAGDLGPPSDEVIEALAEALGADRTELFHLAGRELDRASFRRQVLRELEQLRAAVARLSETHSSAADDDAEQRPLGPAAPMTFEETLAALHGFIGRQVGIGVGDARGTGPRLVGTIQGTLAGGLELRDASPPVDTDEPQGEPPGDTLYFHLEEEPTTGFYLHREHFHGSWWASDGSGELIIATGGLRTVVSESRPDDP